MKPNRKSNRRKHGVRFELAARVFEDPHAMVEQDRVEKGEFRWQTIGMVEGKTVLLVGHTVREEEQDEVASLQREKRHGRSANAMTKIVRKTVAECNTGPSTRRDAVKLAMMPDSDIDLSDLPELTEEFWRNAIPNPFYRPLKKQVTLRIDADILAWLRRQGHGGYQSRLNALLRSLMLRDIESKRKRA